MKFKSQLFGICLLGLGLISCSSCKKSQQGPTGPTCSDSGCPVPSKENAGQNFTGDTWELTVPFGWEKQPTPDEDSNTKLFLSNKDKNNLIIFIKENFNSSFEQYVLTVLKGLKEIDAHLISLTHVEINGNHFVVLETNKNNVTVWTWLTVKDNLGYALSCGGLFLDNWNHDICFNTASSLKIK